MQITANSELGVLSWWAKKRKNTFGDEDFKELERYIEAYTGG